MAPSHLVHLPTHASWLDQIEIYFSILARQGADPCHFDSPGKPERILGFPAQFAQTPPRLTGPSPARDLDALLDRLDQRGRLGPTA